MPDRIDDDRPEEHTPTEGVRILGAQEAQVAAGWANEPSTPEPPRPRRSGPDTPVTPAARFPLPASRRGEPITPSARPVPLESEARFVEEDEPIEQWRPQPLDSPPLPHWTEPPTGEVPRIDDEGRGAEPEPAWMSMTGNQPRFRIDPASWGDSDFDDDFKDESTSLGALVEPGPAPDEEEEFAAAVRARRAPRRAAARAAAPARARPAPGPGGNGDGTHHALVPDTLGTRLVTAAIVAAIGLLAFALGPAATAVLASVVVALCAFELFEGLRRSGFHPATLLGLLGSVALVGVAYNHGERAFPLVTALVVVFTFLWYLVRVVPARPVVNIGVTLLGYGYVGLLGGFAGLLLAAPDGVGIVIGLVICAVGHDVAGYFVGARLGRRLLAPEVSPGKTVEGLIGGALASIVLGLVVSQVISLHPWTEVGDGLLLGLVVAVFAPLGDLCESLLKRDLNIKDFGQLLPGHGGALDRFDAILFCLPAVYYLVLALNIA